MGRLAILNKRIDMAVSRLYKLADAIEKHYNQKKNIHAMYMVMGAWQLRDLVEEVDHGTREACDDFLKCHIEDLLRHKGVGMPRKMQIRIINIQRQLEAVYVWE